MRYIRLSAEKNKTNSASNIWKRIATEMLNLECGKQFYERGVWIASGKSPRPYPEIYDESDPDKRYSVRIKATQGFLYLPGVSSVVECRGVIRKLMEVIRKEILAHPELKAALKSLHSLDTGSRGFTALKSKTNTEKCYTNSYCIYDITNLSAMEFSQRVFSYEPSIQTTNLSQVIPYGKFTWAIMPIDDLYSFVFRDGVSEQVNVSLLSTIIHDKPGILNLSDNDLVFRSLGLNLFNHFGKFHHVSGYGNLKSVILNKLIDSDKSSNYTQEHRENLIESIKAARVAFRTDIKKMQDYPGYSPIARTSSSSIIYNRLFTVAWEIMRWLSPLWNDLFLIGRPFMNLVREMRAEDLRKLYEIEEFSKLNPENSDKCYLCKCPLYDDIYALFADGRSNECKLFCPLCIHASFSPKPGLVSSDLTPDNVCGFITLNNEYMPPVYIQDVFNAKVIGRVKHPRTFNEVVDSINFPGTNLEEYKHILKLFYKNPCVVVKDTTKYIHNYHGMGLHDHEHIAYIVKTTDNEINTTAQTYMFAPISTRSPKRLLQWEHFQDIIQDPDNVSIISVYYMEPRPSRSMVTSFGSGFVMSW